MRQLCDLREDADHVQESSHHEVAESSMVDESDGAERYAHTRESLVSDSNVPHREQSLVIIAQLCVQLQESEQTEVTKVSV